MDIDFINDKLRVICEQQKIATKMLGKPCARKLRTRLADISAAVHVKELVAGRPHPLRHDRLGQYALYLHGGVRLVFEPANNPIPHFDDGGVDWMKVTQVQIIFIGDYHD